MSKYTRRRTKKNRKNKTIKRGGSSVEPVKEDVKEPVKEDTEPVKKQREGIFDMIGNKISGAASSATKSLSDAGLKIIGLKRIDKEEEEREKKIEEENQKKIEEEKSNKIDESVEKIGDAASGVISGVENALDKTGAVLLNTTNAILESDEAKESTEEAAEETANLLKEGASTINDALDQPEVKKEVKEALDNIGEVGEIAVEAAEKPLNKMVDVAAEATPKIVGATAAGLMKVGWDMLGSVPYLGGIIDIGRAVNDGSKAISASIEAGSEIAEVTSDAVKETTQKFDEGMKELNEKKIESQEITDRTTKSIEDFENPTKNTQSGGYNKTKRRLNKHKGKSKRVRFAL
jgi:hypothetical protein